MRRKHRIYTIGHSTHSAREFNVILKSYGIEVLVDIRHYPGSRYCPQFGKARLRKNLAYHNIEYIHLVDLGGRRSLDKSSDLNSAWRSAAFRGYADYMQTDEFASGLKKLMQIAKTKNTVMMCSEAVPWRCHRSLVGDALIVRNFDVLDIFSETQVKPHKLTSFAEVVGSHIIYPASSKTYIRK